jgi:hypothetical protein
MLSKIRHKVSFLRDVCPPTFALLKKLAFGFREIVVYTSDIVIRIVVVSIRDVPAVAVVRSTNL